MRLTGEMAPVMKRVVAAMRRIKVSTGGGGCDGGCGGDE